MKKFPSWSRINAQNILRAVGSCTGRNRDVFFNCGGKGIPVLCYLCVEILCITANKPDLQSVSDRNMGIVYYLLLCVILVKDTHII